MQEKNLFLNHKQFNLIQTKSVLIYQEVACQNSLSSVYTQSSFNYDYLSFPYLTINPLTPI